MMLYVVCKSVWYIFINSHLKLSRSFCVLPMRGRLFQSFIVEGIKDLRKQFLLFQAFSLLVSFIVHSAQFHNFVNSLGSKLNRYSGAMLFMNFEFLKSKFIHIPLWGERGVIIFRCHFQLNFTPIVRNRKKPLNLYIFVLNVTKCTFKR